MLLFLFACYYSWLTVRYAQKKKKVLIITNYVQYTAFDQLKQRLLKGKLKKEGGDLTSPEALSAFSAFVLGAVSKCIATCITYPAIR